MKFLVGFLLFLNLALGLWNYTHGPAPVHIPRPIHPERLGVVVASLPEASPARPLAPMPAMPIPSLGLPANPPVPPKTAAPPQAAPKGGPPAAAHPLKKIAFTKAQAARSPAVSQCWDLGPVAQPAAAAAFLRRAGLRGRVVSRMGPPAYRIYLPAGAAWPDAARLRRLGVSGAYVTHGPAGGEVLSLGVFLSKGAAARELRTLRAHRLAALIGPFAVAARYYAEIRGPSGPQALWKRLAGIGHRPCAGPR